SALEMLEAVRAALPADVGIFAAAVADWRVARAASQKLKKRGKEPPRLELTENPDILKTIASAPISERPPLVIGFAAETENVVENAKLKRKAKGANWIVANDVSPAGGVMGGDRNTVHLVTAEGVDSWPELDNAEGLPLPAYQSDGAAGLDLLAAVEAPVVLRPGKRTLIPTGLVLDLPLGF